MSDAGSRAIPDLLIELKAAVDRNDITAGTVMYRELNYVRVVSKEGKFSEDARELVWSSTPKTLPIDSLRAISREFTEWWERNQHSYPSWWMWWTGRRGNTGD
jgi:hypothetical protein